MKIIQVPNKAIVTVQWVEDNPMSEDCGLIKTKTYTGLIRGDVVMLKYAHELNDEILEHLGALNKDEDKLKHQYNIKKMNFTEPESTGVVGSLTRKKEK